MIFLFTGSKFPHYWFNTKCKPFKGIRGTLVKTWTSILGTCSGAFHSVYWPLSSLLETCWPSSYFPRADFATVHTSCWWAWPQQICWSDYYPFQFTFHVHYTTRFFIVVFDCIDMFSGLASIFTVTLISLERMHAISWPLRHRSLSNRVYVAGIALPWILAAMVTSTRLLLHFSIITRCHFVILIIISLSSPLTITICCYRSIWKNIKSRLPNPHRTGSDEKLIKTLM